MNTSTSHKYIFQTYIYQILPLISAFILLIGTTPLQAENTINKKKAYSSDLPIDIVSDQMEANQDNSMIEFSGNVVATQGNMEIRADSIKIFFDSSNPSSSRGTKQTPKIEKIISNGNVQCLTDQRNAFADQAIFKSDKQIIVMTGKLVKLLEGKNEVTGQKLTLFMEEDRAIMESNINSRVRASFAPSKDSIPNDNS